MGTQVRGDEPIRFLFVHGWSGFCLAEWYLRDALETSSPVPVELRSYDMPVSGVPINDTLPRLLVTWKPDVVGFSCHYWSMRAFMEAARWVKHLLPDSRVVLGGPQVNSPTIAGQVLQSEPQVDFVLRGAVQEALGTLLAGIRSGEVPTALPGLSWRHRGMVRHNELAETRGRRQGPIFHGGNVELTDFLSTANEASYETVIGCRARCAYCIYPSSQFELIDDDLVQAELAYLCSLSIPCIRICDAHFAGQRGRAKKLLRHMARVNRRSSFKVYPDVRHVDREYIELLQDANADITSIGVQTTNPASLEAIRRQPVDERLEQVQMLLEAFPDTPADVIVGLPADHPEGLEKTLRDLCRFGFRRINAFRLHLFPGTTLGDMPDQYMDMPGVTQSYDGQLLSAPNFPPESLEHVANLVHAAEIVLPLAQTRSLLASRHRANRLMDLARRLPSDTLLEVRSRMTGFYPIRLVRDFEKVVRTLSAALEDDDPQVRDMLRRDLLTYLRAHCAERHIRHMQWGADAEGRIIKRVEVPLESGQVAAWDLAAGKLSFDFPRPPSPEPSCLWLGLQPEEGAGRRPSEGGGGSARC